ncbi:MAG: aldo/keto reductase [Phycisphaerales bacterium]|nr:MAG: aldo/keto reductase [Phycisphaerales bacterium]
MSPDSMNVEQRQWVDFGKRSGLKCHRVSIGAMRLPDDEDEAARLMRQAIDAGMIYIDTSRGYGASEIKVGKSLKEGYREKVILSTKWSPWNQKVEETDDASAACTYKRLVESMERLDVEHLDFYQVWSINSYEQYRQVIAKGGMLDGIRRAVDEGLVGHMGFTTHDTPENVSNYLDETDWCEAILFTYNILNQKYQEVIAKAHEKGIATIVMNPLGGGLLAENSPVIRNAIGRDDVVALAHRYLAGDPNVDTILCGISKPSDITGTLENFAKPPLTAEERKTLEKLTDLLSKENMGFCTRCNYCMPCPNGLDIPGILHVVYLERLLECPKVAGDLYKWVANPDKRTRATDCTECGECEDKCTQKLSIMEEMKYAAGKFDEAE